MPDALNGFVEGQGNFGKEVAGIGAVNALYGSKSTDLYANASYRHQEGNKGVSDASHDKPFSMPKQTADLFHPTSILTNLQGCRER